MTNAKLIEIYKAINASADLVLAQIQARNIDWQHFVEYGMSVEAIRSYRTKYGCGLKEAHDVITAYRAELLVQAHTQLNTFGR